jgi:hypothetical protein
MTQPDWKYTRVDSMIMHKLSLKLMARASILRDRWMEVVIS